MVGIKENKGRKGNQPSSLLVLEKKKTSDFFWSTQGMREKIKLNEKYVSSDTLKQQQHHNNNSNSNRAPVDDQNIKKISRRMIGERKCIDL